MNELTEKLIKSGQSEGGAKANAKGVVPKIKYGKCMKELSEGYQVRHLPVGQYLFWAPEI